MTPLMGPVPDTEGSGSSRFSKDSLLGLLRPATRGGRVLLLFPAVSAAFTVGILLFLGFGSNIGDAFADGLPAMLGFTIVLSLYNFLAPAGLVVLISLASRHFVKGMVVVTVGCVTYTARTFYLLILMIRDESSTSVLLLGFLPLYLAPVILATAAGAVLIHFLRSRLTRQ